MRRVIFCNTTAEAGDGSPALQLLNAAWLFGAHLGCLDKGH